MSRTVVQESRSCLVSVSSELQFISSSSSMSDINGMSSCGSRTHPWRLQAPLGQRIDISLLDFTGTSRDTDVTCRQYGYILEKSNKRNVSICASGTTVRQGEVSEDRENAVLTSESNKVDIVLVDAADGNHINHLIKVTGELTENCSSKTISRNLKRRVGRQRSRRFAPLHVCTFDLYFTMHCGYFRQLGLQIGFSNEILSHLMCLSAMHCVSLN